MAVALHYGGVIGKTVVVGLAVGGLQQLDVEGLWRLHEPVVATRNSVG